MTYIIVGLGNPGEEYKNTRHNTGRIVLESFKKSNDFSDWDSSKKYDALVSEGKVGKEKVILAEPETFMNKSGQSLAKLVTSKKGLETLAVIYDDLDLPIGTYKLSFNKSSGGHRGLESIIKALKSQEFLRIRVGVCPTTPSGKLKKPKGEKEVIDHIIGEFKKPELETLKKLSKQICESIEIFIKEGREKATSSKN
jgi:PTH1 family peptidyl-tRNA hydrolase